MFGEGHSVGGAPADERSARRGRWVLLVDDDAELREALREVLDDAGYSVTLAADGVEALGLIHASARAPDLILLDLRMPRMSGWGVLAALRSSPLLVQTPVIVLSADLLATPAGAVAWLRKPVAATQLLSTLRSVRVE
jgi:CheY-like chemotaxis protein